MIFRLAFGLALIVGVVGHHSRAAEPTKQNGYAAYEQLKKLEWMVGEWTAEIEDDGQVVTLPFTGEWLHDRKFFRARFQGIRGGKVLWENEVTWYWDPAEKVVRNQSFQDTGTWGRATAEVGNEVIRGKVNYVGETGQRLGPFEYILQRKGPDSFTWWEDEGPGVIEYRRK